MDFQMENLSDFLLVYTASPRRRVYESWTAQYLDHHMSATILKEMCKDITASDDERDAYRLSIAPVQPQRRPEDIVRPWLIHTVEEALAKGFFWCDPNEW